MRKSLAVVLGVTLLMAGAISAAPGAAPAEPAAIHPAMGTPFTAFCVDCYPCGEIPDHEAPVDANGGWSSGHGSHEFCWEGQSCGQKHGGACFVPEPFDDFTDLLESARLAALSETPEAFVKLQRDAPSYVSFNESRGSIQVNSCADADQVVANLPAVWADAWIGVVR